MKGQPVIACADLRAILEDVTPHLTAIDGGIAAAASAGPALCRLYALAQLTLVKVSDGREPVLESAS